MVTSGSFLSVGFETLYLYQVQAAAMFGFFDLRIQVLFDFQANRKSCFGGLEVNNHGLRQ
jgi:hypothetical protein